MGDHGRPRRDEDSRKQVNGGAGVRTPSSSGGSSSPEIPKPSLDTDQFGPDTPTLVPLSDPKLPEDASKRTPPAPSPSDAATMVPLPHDSDSPTLLDAPSPFPTTGRPPSPPPRAPSPAPRSAPSTQAFYNPLPILAEGTVLATRYEIVRTLGEGGMGAVYQAKDLELNRMVALKVIRPELAKNPAIIDRFKQELLLSQRVTHRNVIRIYDLGEGDGVKFITMEFIEGQDLRSLIFDRKKFPPEEAVGVMEQVCLALDSAHSVGVIHRDLKPQNIMMDGNGRILVMDFGLARTLGGDGMTQSGALVGTMEYMSPEQALAQDLDQRSDLFSAGLIFYEMLTGQMPFRADSALASLIKRTQERAAPISAHGEGFPENLSKIVSKCLERDPAARYQTAKEFLADLQAWEGKLTAGAVNFQSVKPWGQDIPWPKIGMGVAAVVLAVVGFVYRDKLFAPAKTATHQAATVPSQSLAILPFHNASGDANLDWLGSSLADMLSTEVGQSAQLHTVNPANLHQIFTDLRISSATVLDPATIRRVADFSNADRVVWGQYAKFGDQIRIDATLQDVKNDRTIPLKIDVAGEKEIPAAIDRLAESIRQKLALPENVLRELKASSFKPSSQSMAALRDYNQGVGFQREGKNLEAQKQFEAATKEDPSFALAFAKLAQSYSSLGYDSEAEQTAQKAVTLSQNLPDAEKYLISAMRSQVMKNYPEAIKAYENLAKASPGNAEVQTALASLYKDSGDLLKAREYYQKLLSANPKDITATLELGRIAIKSGDAQGSLDLLNRSYTLATEVDNQEQKAASLHFMAVAYDMLNKPEESVRSEEQALDIWKRIGQKRGLALSLNEMASAQASLGKTKDALANYEQALQVRREIGDRRGLGDTLIDLGNFYNERGDYDQALKMYKESLQLQRDLGNESLQALCLNNIGTVYSEKGQYEDALTYYQQAVQLREKSKVPQDIVEAVHNLGDTSADMGQYDQAIAYYLRALDLRRSMDDRRGAAIESYSLGTLFEYQGRFGAAINSKQDALKTFREIKDKTYWMAKVLDGVAQAFILAGRGNEAKSHLDEALSFSRELKSDGMIAETLGFQGDAFFYAGDLKSARTSYEQALQAAIRSKEPDTTLIAKSNLAELAVQEKRGREAVSSLRPLIQQANDLGLKYISVESSISMAEAMMQSHDNSQARQELGRALQLADKLGQQPLSARAHYLLAVLAKDSGDNNEAQDHFREVIRLLDAMKKDPGAEKLLQRSDFKSIYDAAKLGLPPAS
jgi:eukaryotic-like serine/threonine-protein kinase